MGAIDWFIEEQERKMRVPIPLGVKDFKNRAKLERALDNKSMEAVNLFFKTHSNFDFNALNFLSEELKENRAVGKADQDFINKLVNELKKTEGYDQCFSNSLGSLLQIEETLLDLNFENTPKRVMVAIFLWSYLTIIENAVSDLSEMFYRIAIKNNDKKYASFYEGLLKRGEHPMFNQLKKTALRWKLIKPQDATFLTTSNLRNYISHANLYYDSTRDKILLPNREELSFSKLQEEYRRVNDFFKELLFKMNDSDNDLTSAAEKVRKGLEKGYLKLVRSGATKKLWRSKMPWEK